MPCGTARQEKEIRGGCRNRLYFVAITPEKYLISLANRAKLILPNYTLFNTFGVHSGRVINSPPYAGIATLLASTGLERIDMAGQRRVFNE
jgi:hypothetical protein